MPDESPKIFVIHGPNLNLLGTREPEVYGHTTLNQLNMTLNSIAERHHVSLECMQSNDEGQIIDWIQKAIRTTQGLIINPAGYTHTSVAIRDALAMYDNPSIEVHISNIYSREAFREQSLVSPVVTGTIGGLGVDSYRLALLWMVHHFEKSTKK